MATLGDLRTKMRVRVLNASSANYYDDADLLGILEDASREIAAAFRFPKALTSAIALSAGDITIGGLPANLVDVEAVNFAGVTLAKRAYPYVKMMQQLPQARWPRGYFFDTHFGTGATLMIGPPPSAGGDAVVEYVADPYGGSVPISTTDVWGGAHENFHELVLLRGAVKAFELTFEIEDAAYYVQRYGQVLSEFAQFMNMPVPARMQSAGAPQ